MTEGQSRGVQTEAPQRIAPGAVAPVADHGVAELGHLDPDLVAPASAEPERDPRDVRPALEDAVAGDRDAGAPTARRRPAGVDRADAERALLHEDVAERSLVLPHHALDDRDVAPIRGAGRELALEGVLGLRALGDDQESRGLAVQPVDDEGPAGRARALEIGPHEAVRRALPLVLGPDRQEAGRLLDDEEGGVLVDQAEQGREGGRGRRPERHPVRVRDRRARVADGLASDSDAAGDQPRPKSPPGRVRERLAQPLEHRRHGVRPRVSSRGMSETRPAPRTPFFDFQARNRRATWRLTLVYALVVGGFGVLSAIGFTVNVFLALFALVFFPAVLSLGVGALMLLTPVTRWLADPIWDAGLVPLGIVGDLPGRLPGDGASIWVIGLGLPLLCWLAVRAVWLTAGVGHTLLAIGARPPAPADLEEAQLQNVVHEMAIAAGIPAPEVRLLDARVANAAAVGTGLDRSYVVVGRRLLDEFDRDETQGILGHLIGSIGNGDLRGAAQIHSLLYVLELLIVVMLAPFARVPRRIAGRWLLFPLWSLARSAEDRAGRARELMQLLLDHRQRAGGPGGTSGSDDPVARMGPEYFGPVGRVLVRICPPLIALFALGAAATGFLLLFASLPVALLWRSRRYLADATAVELTRNPTGLHRGLRRLGDAGAVIPGGEEVVHLFIVGPEGDRPQPRGSFTEREGLLMSMHPSLKRRLQRLERMGVKA
jgi:Zn-dependent protease with chaperone function